MPIDAPSRFAVMFNRRCFRWVTPVTISLALISLTTALLWQFDASLRQEHLIFIYFVPTTLIALRYGSMSAMGVIVASCLAAAYFLYPPKFSLAMANGLDILELTLFSLLALFASQVVSGIATTGSAGMRRRSGRSLGMRTKWPAASALLGRLRFEN